MSLDARVSFRLPDDLPPLPGQPEAMEAVEVEAINRRLDLQMPRHDITALAQSLRLTEATRYVSMLQLAGLFNSVSCACAKVETADQV